MKNKKKLIAAGFTFAFAIAGYYGMSISPELAQPLTDAVCALAGC